MSFYTDAIETVYVNPSFDSKNFRTEFILEPNKVYLPTLRMCGLGHEMNVGGSNAQFNRLVGAYGLIKNIRLLDKGIEIDSCKFCANLQGFRNLNKDPRHNAKIATHLRRTQLGFTHVCETGNGMNENTAATSVVKAGRDSENTNEDAGADANVYLGECLPILKSMNVLSTQMFRHLKLIIEYETDLSRVVANNQDKTFTTRTPLLVIDEIVDKETQQKLVSSMKNIAWTSYEHDRFDVPGVPAPGGMVEQVVDVKLNGPKNKSIGRVLVVKQLAASDATVNTGGDNVVCGNVGSLESEQEKYQLRINGANILPEQGVTKCNEQLALLTQTFGPISMTPFAHFGSKPSGLANLTNEGGKDASQLGHFGIAINDYVQDFQLTYKRRNNNTGTPFYTNKALSVHVYYEVQKMLQLQGGTYRIVYA